MSGEPIINLHIYNVHLDTEELPATIKAATESKSGLQRLNPEGSNQSRKVNSQFKPLGDVASEWTVTAEDAGMRGTWTLRRLSNILTLD